MLIRTLRSDKILHWGCTVRNRKDTLQTFVPKHLKIKEKSNKSRTMSCWFHKQINRENYVIYTFGKTWFIRNLCSSLKDLSPLLSQAVGTSMKANIAPEANRWHAELHWEWTASSSQQARVLYSYWFNCTEVFSTCAAGKWLRGLRQHPEAPLRLWALLCHGRSSRRKTFCSNFSKPGEING